MTTNSSPRLELLAIEGGGTVPPWELLPICLRSHQRYIRLSVTATQFHCPGESDDKLSDTHMSHPNARATSRGVRRSPQEIATHLAGPKIRQKYKIRYEACATMR
jgi:hypothetical protein